MQIINNGIRNTNKAIINILFLPLYLVIIFFPIYVKKYTSHIINKNIKLPTIKAKYTALFTNVFKGSWDVSWNVLFIFIYKKIFTRKIIIDSAIVIYFRIFFFFISSIHSFLGNTLHLIFCNFAIVQKQISQASILWYIIKITIYWNTNTTMSNY